MRPRRFRFIPHERQWALTTALALAIIIPGLGLGQTIEDCLTCHEDPELVGEIGGVEVSMHVDPAGFRSSVHGEFGCVDCHADLDGAELPHDEELEPVDCGTCHDDMAADLAAGPHGKWAGDPTSPSAACVGCHGAHDVLSSKTPGAPTGPARVDDLCARCHGVVLKAVSASPHGRMVGDRPAATCADCHLGHAVIAPTEPLLQLDACGTCHVEQAAENRGSLHGRAAVKGDPAAPNCIICHDHHAIRPSSDPAAPTAIQNIPLLCGRCHREGTEVSLQHDIPQDRILENFSMSVHGDALFHKGLTVTAVCTSCHTAHNILDHNNPASSISRGNVARTCMKCHGRIEEVHVKVVEGRLWEEEPHKIPSCVECHQPHKIRRRAVTAQEASSQSCLACHGDPTLSVERDGEKVSLFVDPDRFALGSHAQTACAQCHTDVTPGHKERPCATIASPVDCGICHAARVEEHDLSRHGALAAEGDPDAPTCVTCHDHPHTVLDHRLPMAPTYSRNVPNLCGECHAAGGAAALRLADDRDIVGSYLESAHGRGLMGSGLVVSASCIDCHTAHSALPQDDPRSTVSRGRILDTCGACHKGIEEEFKRSVHFPANVVTNQELPTCESCHTSHEITRIDAQGFRMMMMNQCGRCHEGFAETFFDTYHGKVTQLGSEGAAKCYDCHGTHNILPSDNPDSRLSRRHVVETCGQCHPRAHLEFAGYLSHATHHDKDKYPFLFYSYWFMTILLVGTLTFFLVHTLLWLFRLWRTRDVWRPLKENGEVERRYYIRFTSKQRIMHFVMLLCFFALALSGMALKFSFMGWAHAVSRILGGYESMGTLHRWAAVVLIGLFVYHLRDVFRAKAASGKGWFAYIFGPNSLMFNLTDLTQFWQSTKWFLGRGPRPHYGRFTYWEKFDYFAVFWGVFVIGSTGLVLWFPELFTRLLPGWSVNVATIIHSDEALLAVGFIFTIHFFNTHFRPDKFPMDPVIFTGRVPLDELRHDKPGEYEEFVEGADEAVLAQRVKGPAKRRIEKAARIVGFTALAIGLTLIFLIVYTMVFGYR
ncbi:MAG: cytochrome c3 family protein [Thermoanaerobaculales bacterium]|nr:cytochrome c3 family protein [Thermoanaerobaculales bacterium]